MKNRTLTLSSKDSKQVVSTRLILPYKTQYSLCKVSGGHTEVPWGEPVAIPLRRKVTRKNSANGNKHCRARTSVFMVRERPPHKASNF